MATEAVSDSSAWLFSETRIPDLKIIDRLGNSFLTGNGFIGYRGTLEEYAKEQKTAVIASGLYDKCGDLWREPVNLPNGGFLQAAYKGMPLLAHAGSVARHTQSLDIREGIHRRETVFSCADGNRITLRVERFVSAVRLSLLCMQVSIEAERDCELVITCGIDGDVWDLNGPHLCDFHTTTSEPAIGLSAFAQENRIPVAVCERIETANLPQTLAIEPNRILRQIPLRLLAGESHTLTKFAAFHTGLDSSDPLAAGQGDCELAFRVGWEELRREHRAAWEARWSRCDLQIDGDEEAQRALRFSLYHLLAIAPSHSEKVSIPARGLSGQVYKGGVFWDTDIFMLPFFAHTEPTIARNLVMYRYHTLDGARRKAREYGYRGAFYAWESQDTGDDACTLYNITDVFTNRPMRTYFRDKQIHISADVAYAIWNYFSITGDETVLLDGGAEVIFECARFFLSAVYFHPEKDRYELLDVTGPDEYHERVNNNAYTNWMAAKTFDICLRTHSLLAEKHPEESAKLLAKLKFFSDLDSVRIVASRFYLPAPDPATSLIPQFDGYFQLEDVPIADLLARKLHPNEYLGGGNGIATQTQVLKQADVVLAMCLFRDRQSLDALRANWEYYELRTEQGSSLSACSYAISAAQIGKLDRAYRFFMDTATIDWTGEPKQYVGTLYIGGTHPAANGGAWMAAAYGFCGIFWDGHTLFIRPRLPGHWQEIRLPFALQGNLLQLAITHSAVSVQLAEGSRKPIRLSIDGKTHLLDSFAPKTIGYREEGNLK